MNQGFSSLLNFFRWSAALLVILSHLRNIVLVDYETVLHKTPAVKALYFISGLGHEAVVLFFIISGLLVGGLSLQRWRAGALDFGSYFVNRFSRIYVVLLPALLCGGLFDLLGLHFFNQSGLYTHATGMLFSTLNYSVENRLDGPSLLASAAMLQPFTLPSLGSNGPLWSLSYEWWYYCLFAAALACAGATSWYGRAALALLLAGLAVWLPLELMVWMLVWLLGVGVALYARSGLPRPHPLAGAAAFVSALLCAKAGMKFGVDGATQAMLLALAKDMLLGLGFAVLLLAFYRAPEVASDAGGMGMLARCNERLADFSYTSYLCHFPFMLLLLAISTDLFGIPLKQQPGTAVLLYFGAALGAVYLYTFAFSLLTERHTGAVRDHLSAWLTQHRSAAAAR